MVAGPPCRCLALRSEAADGPALPTAPHTEGCAGQVNKQGSVDPPLDRVAMTTLTGPGRARQAKATSIDRKLGDTLQKPLIYFGDVCFG